MWTFGAVPLFQEVGINLWEDKAGLWIASECAFFSSVVPITNVKRNDVNMVMCWSVDCWETGRQEEKRGKMDSSAGSGEAKLVFVTKIKGWGLESSSWWFGGKAPLVVVKGLGWLEEPLYLMLSELEQQFPSFSAWDTADRVQPTSGFWKSVRTGDR